MHESTPIIPRLLAKFREGSLSLTGKERRVTFKPPETMDPDIFAITAPYYNALARIVVYLSKNRVDGVKVSTDRRRKLTTALWATVKDSQDDIYRTETAQFSSRLSWTKQDEYLDVVLYSFKPTNITEGYPICDLELLCDEKRITRTDLTWNVSNNRAGPYELVGIGAIKIGDSGMNDFFKRYVPKLEFDLRDGETSSNKMYYRLSGSCPSLYLQNIFRSGIGFDRWLGDSIEVLGPRKSTTIKTESIFNWDPAKKLFIRRFYTAGDQIGYIQANRHSDRKMGDELTLNRQEFLDVLKSTLALTQIPIGGENNTDMLQHA